MLITFQNNIYWRDLRSKWTNIRICVAHQLWQQNSPLRELSVQAWCWGQLGCAPTPSWVRSISTPRNMHPGLKSPVTCSRRSNRPPWRRARLEAEACRRNRVQHGCTNAFAINDHRPGVENYGMKFLQRKLSPESQSHGSRWCVVTEMIDISLPLENCTAPSPLPSPLPSSSIPHPSPSLILNLSP